ncbi:MAG TPA: hypothetical protein VGF07_06435 [Stellaceae bacterium]
MTTGSEIQQLIDHHFEHVSPARIAEMNGVFNLDAEVARLGSTAVEGAMAKILSTGRLAHPARDPG